MRRYTGALLGLALLAGCATVGPLERRLEGRWQWVESTGGLAGLRRTPQSEGYNQELVFYSHKLEVWRSGKLVTVLRYRIERKRTLLQPEPGDVLVYEDLFLPEQLIRWGRGDTLYLADVCADCFVHTYVRRR
ncbi:MAG: hypothetical protein N2561_09415 [Bacteroidetes bacterium]|nr:hypothetical protein [Rhodothermia bacterium]MCS7156044.1 hypothetical protein [Bacteroidota bacterium]MCX7907732.1 hypothetical protein [Bacteroidota bacterium]MDW8137861.1 hypothetical protein [Bacteroidota bacterium]MDW8286288.1 hypothetical protein [Bacteroidota bacterium]